MCDSLQGLRFNTVPPVKKSQANPLSFCQGYWKNTCCNKSHTDTLQRRDRLVAAAKFSADCRHHMELVTCSSCHPDVGTFLFYIFFPSPFFLCNIFSSFPVLLVSGSYFHETAIVCLGVNVPPVRQLFLLLLNDLANGITVLVIFYDADETNPV
jgi:hypothetical protein